MSNLILHSSSTRANLTEWCIFEPNVLIGDFINQSSKTLFDRIISDTLANCLHIKDIVENSLYSNTTNVVEQIGLKNIIVDTLMKKTTTYIKVEVVNNAIIYTKLTNYNINKDPDNNILVINCETSPINSLYDYYGLIYRYLIFANSVLELANKPLIKLNEYRSQSTNLANGDSIKKQVTESLESLKRKNGFAILDSKDVLDMFTIDVTKYDSLLTQGYNGIADIFGLPISYFTGEIAGGLNSLGEADRVKTQDVLYRYYKNMLQNVLKRVYNIIGEKYEVVYKEYLEFKLKGILPVLQALDRTSLINEEQKNNIINKILD